MKVRGPKVSDAAHLAAIHNPLIRETSITFSNAERSEADYLKAFDELPCFLVGEVDGQVAGFISYDQFRKGPGYARTVEHTIIVSGDVRGRGVGRALILAAEAQARAEGRGSLIAGISSENPQGVAFHGSVGFEEVARLPRVGFKFGRWMDLIVMQKWLDDDPDQKA